MRSIPSSMRMPDGQHFQTVVDHMICDATLKKRPPQGAAPVCFKIQTNFSPTKPCGCPSIRFAPVRRDYPAGIARHPPGAPVVAQRAIAPLPEQAFPPLQLGVWVKTREMPQRQGLGLPCQPLFWQDRARSAQRSASSNRACGSPMRLPDGKTLACSVQRLRIPARQSLPLAGSPVLPPDGNVLPR